MPSHTIEFKARAAGGESFVWRFIRVGETVTLGDDPLCTWHVKTPQARAFCEVSFDGKRLVLVPKGWVYSQGNKIARNVVLDQSNSIELGGLSIHLTVRVVHAAAVSEGSASEKLAHPNVRVKTEMLADIATLWKPTSSEIVKKIKRAKAEYESSETGSSTSAVAALPLQRIPRAKLREAEPGATVAEDPGRIREYAAGLATPPQEDPGYKPPEPPPPPLSPGPRGNSRAGVDDLFALPGDLGSASDAKSEKEQKPKTRSKRRKIVLGLIAITSLLLVAAAFLVKTQQKSAATVTPLKVKVWGPSDLPTVQERKGASIFVVQASGDAAAAASERGAADHYLAGRLLEARNLYSQLARQFPKDRRYLQLLALIHQEIIKRCSGDAFARDPMCLKVKQ